jgi:hypothetical protein
MPCSTARQRPSAVKQASRICEMPELNMLVLL